MIRQLYSSLHVNGDDNVAHYGNDDVSNGDNDDYNNHAEAQRGVGSQKCLVMGNFQSVPCYRKGTDQKPPITRHF